MMLREQLLSFAQAYDLKEESLTGQGDDQSSIHYPAIFLFIGDKSKEGIVPLMRMNEKKWENSEGLIYIHCGLSGMTVSRPIDGVRRGNVMEYRFPWQATSSKTQRSDLYRNFYKDSEALKELNRLFRNASTALAEQGRLYPAFDRVRLFIVTRVDDPLNVLVPELSLLAEAIFKQSFKSVQMDLFALISEREGKESFGYSSSLGVAFLHELELMQSPNYNFEAPLHVTEDGIAIAVEHPPSPLFDLVYVLSDRDERGIASKNGLTVCYDLISFISLLKNMQHREQAWGTSEGAYNNSAFKNNLMTESGRYGYVSAGLARVKRPNHSIALAVLYHFFCGLLTRMQQEPQLSIDEKLAFLGLDNATLEKLAEGMVPEESKLAEMHGLMSYEVNFGALRKLSLKEAEEALFSGAAESFFARNFKDEAALRLQEFRSACWVEKALHQSLQQYPEVQIYALFGWTADSASENTTGSVMTKLCEFRRDTENRLAQAKAELEQFRQGLVEEQPFRRIPLLDRHNLRNLIHYIFDHVYPRKRKILLLEMKLKVINKLENAVSTLHSRCLAEIKQLEALERELRETACESMEMADDYTGQNIMEYYGRVTAEIMAQLESKRGSQTFFEEGALGNSRNLLEQGLHGLADRLIESCQRLILISPTFTQTFEQELLLRANVNVEYGNHAVLTKEELFNQLSRILEEQAAIRVRLREYTQEHRYEEKYIFGDYSSELVQYMIQDDQGTRSYKLGCVHEQRSTGLEKLHLMGGFHVEDLVYYLNGRAYYESYKQNGYVFHGIDEACLPALH